MARSRIGRAAHAVRRLLAVGPSTWVRLAEAQVELLRARRKVRSQGRGFRVERRERAEASVPSGGDAMHERRIGEAIALDVGRVGAFGLIAPTCLERSLAIVAMLARRGVQSAELRVGVRRTDGRFAAHAWVELAGGVVGDDPRVVQSYLPLDEIAVENLQ